MPLPSTRVIGPRWSEHHRPAATGSQTAVVRITRTATDGTTGGDGTWTPPARTTVYDGTARISPHTSEQRFVIVGDRRTVIRECIVAIEWDAAEVLIEDLVEVVEAVDPRLPGVVLRVEDVQGGSEQWERILVATEVLAAERQ
ncbi:DUF6093 family protein [Spongiactinospora sp. TRM90649]|uniref:DUF6093 family protein n=1 Tax=Spongiactinospora sp. TRM90649 TaxID=3031114 RepID=UPI0023F6202A|nr:DUF6093 family protein [Spongiactinospora sp. TRM90649]MDF5758612.1 DUF6093 family protein [Spongiactinospora sp. TRM90649]